MNAVPQENNSDEKPGLLPSIDLPKGGGAINGIGEKFNVNPATGTAGFSVPLPVGPARQGFQPALGLNYDSGNGNTPFGFGWDVGLSAITRKTNKGLPTYSNDDIFVISGAEDLVPKLNKKGTKWIHKMFPKTDAEISYEVFYYIPRIEGLFARIEKWVAPDGDIHWRTLSKENILTIYGRSTSARIHKSGNPKHTYKWLIESSYDNLGNEIQYCYKQEDRTGIDFGLAQEAHRKNCFPVNTYLEKVKYGKSVVNEIDWHFQTVFDYGEYDSDNPQYTPTNDWNTRQDPFSTYRSGFEIRTYRLCQRVLLFHTFRELDVELNPELNGEFIPQPLLVQSIRLNHTKDEKQKAIATTLESVLQTGYKKKGNTYETKSLPLLEFTYSEAIIDQQIKALPKESMENIPAGIGGTSQWLDLHGEGIPGVLTVEGNSWRYKHNLGDGNLAPSQLLAEIPSMATPGFPQLMDVNQDGGKELVINTPDYSGYYTKTEEGWENYVPFPQMPNVDWHDPNLKLIDLTGDGFADILITEEDQLRWFPGKGKEGYDAAVYRTKTVDENEGPALVFGDKEQAIYLADMSGDGLSDIVRIRNKDIVYWPNLGYGNFGPKVTMGNAPVLDAPDQFNRARIRLTDFDGSGTTDLCYLTDQTVKFWINQSGNSYAVTQQLDFFPDTDQLASVQLVDLLGVGTPCLVWSSLVPEEKGTIRYIDLMSTEKPYLLKRVINNMGKEDSYFYSTSTKFYLEDKKAGTPWETKLSFPVHVVERTESKDLLSGESYGVSYAYHNGYFDPYEREFRGFGMVEQKDAENFEDFKKNNSGEAITHYLDPVLTKTWFHTGATPEDATLQLWQANPIDANIVDHLPPVEFDIGFENGFSSYEDKREAYRALKGQTLRQEVYVLKDNIKKPPPFSISMSGVSVHRWQAKHDNEHSVYLVSPRESFSQAFENNVADPRVNHQVVIKTDKYGSPLESCAIVYGRIPAAKTHPEQEQNHIILTTESVGHKDQDEGSAYLLGIPLEGKTYEIGNVKPGGTYFKKKELQKSIQKAKQQIIPFDTTIEESNYKDEENGNPVAEKMRLLSWQKPFYWDASRTNSTDELAELGWPVLPHHNEVAVFTPDLILNVYDSKVSPQLLTQKGKYILRDNHWWAPSPIQKFDSEQNFNLPLSTKDPFGNEAFIKYDDYLLAPLTATDALGNSVISEIDYRTLSPRKVTDPNGNFTEVETDPLGLVITTALTAFELDENDVLVTKGDKPISEYIERELSSSNCYPDADPLNPPPNPIELVVRNPKHYLQGASSFFFYDLEAWSCRGEAPQYIGLVREEHAMEHGGMDAPIQMSIGYSDGFGRELQSKLLVEDGPAILRNVNGTLQRDATGNLIKGHATERWLSSGRTIYNNKGKAVKQYEPFYSTTFKYETENELLEYGLTPVITYDPMGRVIRTDMPDGTFSKVEFDAWEQHQFDANDTVLESEWFQREWGEKELENIPPTNNPGKRAAWLAAQHADTHSSLYLDSLGRPFLSIDRLEDDTELVTKTELDIGGKPIRMTDPRQLELNETRKIQNKKAIREGRPGDVVSLVHNFEYSYDMAGTQLCANSMDGGKGWTFNTALGQPICSWNSRDTKTEIEYDALLRPVKKWVQGKSDSKAKLTQLIIYGEALNDAADRNAIGQVVRSFDSSGLNWVEAYDYKGTPRRANFRLTKDYKDTADWSFITNPFSNTGLHKHLETEIYTTEVKTNAVGKVISQTSPDGSIHYPSYYHSGLLKNLGIDMRGQGKIQKFVKAVKYNEKGQRESITYGNGVYTSYSYDALNYRSKQLTTRKSSSSSTKLQDISYTHDPVGNITTIRDASHDTVFNSNQQISPEQHYTYDSLYRLTKANGRQHNALAGTPHFRQAKAQEYYFEMNSKSQVNNPNDLANYERTYTYDIAGNLTQTQQFGSNAFTRKMEVSDTSNRAVLLEQLRGKDVEFFFDERGNLKSLAHLPDIQWNLEDHLASAALVVRNREPDDREYYVYDASGERVRKVFEKLGDNGTLQIEEKIYLGGVEIIRHYSKTEKGVVLPDTQKRWTTHISDDTQRIALVHYWETDTSNQNLQGQTKIHFQLSNHLGSASMEVNEKAQLISYEEFFPYGETAFRVGRSEQEVALKDYRYTGMERDSHTGLSYHSARYYAPWMHRWLNPDPAGTVDGLNLYGYVRGNPVNFTDTNGNKRGWWFDDRLYDQPHQKDISDDQIKGYIKKNKSSFHIGEYQFEISGTSVMIMKMYLYFYKDLEQKNQAEKEAAANKGDTGWHTRFKEHGEGPFNYKNFLKNDRYLREVQEAIGAFHGKDEIRMLRVILAITANYTSGREDESRARRLAVIDIISSAVTRRVSSGPPKQKPTLTSRTAASSVKKGKPVVDLDENGLPKHQGKVVIDGKNVTVGPAYKTEAEALKSGGGHVAKITVKQDGKVISEWWEASEGGFSKASKHLGHTEQKALARINMNSGTEVDIRGWFPACPFELGCRNTMQHAVNVSDGLITYRYVSPKGNPATSHIQKE